MRLALLGPLRAETEDGTAMDIGGARLRMLLARLGLDAGRAVAAEVLIDGLWADDPPTDSANALQSLVSRLRRALRPAGVQLESGVGGYRLALPADAVDVHRFKQLAAQGRRELAAGREARAAELLDAALELWHGEALADVLDAPFAAAPAARLEELRTEAVEDRFDGELRLGRHADVLADLTAAAEAHPLRERLAGLRIRALSSAGRQADALAVYATIRRTLADELGVDPSAELQEIHLQALRGEFAPVAAVADRLPVRLTSFVGRGDELKLLAELLEGARLVTLVGPGGAGKTRLATEAASRHPAHAAGRVWFVPLAGVRAAGDLLGALLTALEIREVRTAENEVLRRPVDLFAHAVEALSGGETLLVLDNCEHVIDSAAQLADDLLRRVPSLRILATSREPLAITGEALCPLGPLPVPAESTPPSEVGALDSTRLFLDRAAAVRPGFVLDESTVDAVTQICRRLDGMPLALELAAARLRSMPVTGIAERLDDRFRLLTSGSRTALPRQRTLRAVVEWSWDLLSDEELVLARRLAVFASTFDEDAVTAVCADELLPAEDLVYVLGALVEKSIVDTVGDRYRMLETLRVYATERLATTGETEWLRAAMVRYYVDLAERTEPLLRTRDQLDAIALFEQENDNLTDALRAAIESRDGEHAGRLLYGMFWYLSILGQSERGTQFIAGVLDLGDTVPPDIRAGLRLSLIMMDMITGPKKMASAAELIEDCVRTDAMNRNPWLSIAMPMVAFLSGHRELARREIDRATEGASAWGRAAGAWAESFLLADEGEVAASIRARERAHAGFLELGDRWGLAMTFSFRAASLSQNGDHAGAIEAYTEGLRLALELRSGDDVVQQWWRLAVEHSRAGDQAAAWRELAAAGRYVRDSFGGPQLKVILAFGRLELLLREKRIAEARTLVAKLKSDLAEWPFPGSFADEWFGLVNAKLAVAEGDPDSADPHIAAALRSAARRIDMPDLAGAIEVLALVRHAQDEFETAARVLALSAVIRGQYDLGNPEVKAVLADLREKLGAAGYERVCGEVRTMGREAGIAWLLREAGQGLVSGSTD